MKLAAEHSEAEGSLRQEAQSLLALEPMWNAGNLLCYPQNSAACMLDHTCVAGVPQLLMAGPFNTHGDTGYVLGTAAMPAGGRALEVGALRVPWLC